MEPNTPYIILLILVAATSAGLALYSWRYRSASSVVLPFVVLMLAVTEWSFTYGVELANTTLEAKIFWAKMHWFGVVTIPVAWLVFVLNYTGRDGWATKRNVLLLSLLPIISLIVVWTNDYHHLLWRTMELNTTDSPFPTLAVSYGFWFVISAAYFYLLILFSNALLIRSFIHSPHLYRGQIVALLVAAFIPLVADLIHSIGLNHPFPYMDITPVAFALTGLMLAWAIFRYRLLDVVPVARESLFESMPEGVLVLDTQNRVVDINAAALEFINYPDAKVIGLPVVDLLADWPKLVNRFAHVQETQTEITQMIGSEVRHYDLSISPLCNRRGILTGRLIVWRDMTKRRQVEAELERYRQHLEELVKERTEELQESQQRYRALFESANDAIFILDLAGVLLDANQRAVNMLGYEYEALLNLSFGEIVIPNEHQDVEKEINLLLSDQPIPIYEQQFRRKDGSSIPVEVNMLLVRDQEGKPLHIQSIVRDITKRKQAEIELKAAYERLQTLDRLKDDFIDSVSHELRTPLTNLKLYLHLLSSHSDSEKNSSYIKTLRHETGRLEQIIEGIFSVSHLMQELKEITLTKIDLNSLVNQFIANQSVVATAQERQLEFILNTDAKLPLIKGNQVLLESVLEALVTNALSYTPVGGQIRVSTEVEKTKDQQLVFLSVADSGLGIQSDELDHVFERFFRGTAALESGVPGPGLGLFTSKEIIERHAGGIDIYSEGLLGKGVTVRVWLPVI
ncbi:histidine kinase N-terminal 7TM domain-containing protein [Chloroflexota bacterium]